jgi:hypothetical protein
VALLASTAQAQTTVTTSAGDLLLGFEISGGTQNYVLDIGPASYYTGQSSTPGTTNITTSKSLGNFTLDLSSVFGPSWDTQQSGNNVQWGVVGASSTLGSAGGIPVSTYFVTDAEPSSAPAEGSKTSQNTEVNLIKSFGYQAGNGIDNAQSTANSNVGVIESASLANSWSSNTPGTQAFGSSLDVESASNVNPISATLDLYELLPTNGSGAGKGTGSGVFLGDFTLTSGGTLDFTSAAAAVPEPSTYALIFGGLATLFLFRRLRRNSIGA